MNTPALPHREFSPSDPDTIEDSSTARALSTAFRADGHSGDGAQWEDGSTHRRAEPQDTLAPGQYWRCLEAYSVPDERYSGHTLRCLEQEIYLIERVIEFDGSIHSVVLCDAPLQGGSNHIPVVLLDLQRLFTPVDPVQARQIRAAQMDAIMAEVKEAQAEMAEASINPMALPSVVQAVESALAQAEHEHASEERSAQSAKEKRDADLRRIHRRAGRRAQAKGYPLQTTAPAISTSISQMVSHGLNDEMVRTLTLEAGKHLAAGEALGKWLSRKSEDIARTLTRMAPFYQEQQRVAMASAADAVKRVADLQKGIRSLRLYTGDALDVMTLRTGKSAPTSEPLTLFQAKRYMDQELACFMEVDDSFDWRSRETFFAELVANPALLEQIMPAPRCVVSMAVTGRHVQYSRNMHWYDRLKNELANKAVFLLVRDGENLHVVYSDEPSHEAADRLFPTEGDLQGLFDGIDGSRITLADVRFGRASEEFADLALHYKRFLILLCGLDHRMRLMGEFYPPEQASAFMTLEFQQSHMRFVHDDEAALMLEDGAAARPTMPVEDWIMACNARVRTGARVVVPRESLRAALLAGAPRVAKSKLDKSALRGQAGDYFVVRSVGGFHKIDVPVVSDRGTAFKASVFLDGPDAPTQKSLSGDITMRAGGWFLCLDAARVRDVHHYFASRRHRATQIDWIRMLRAACALLEDEVEQQAPLRAFLRTAVLDAQLMPEADVPEAIEVAIATYRAKNGGAVPALDDKAALKALLNLLYPHHLWLSKRRAGAPAGSTTASEPQPGLSTAPAPVAQAVKVAEILATQGAAQADPALVASVRRVCEDNRLQGLRVSLDGNGKLVLYAAPTARDIAPYCADFARDERAVAAGDASTDAPGEAPPMFPAPIEGCYPGLHWGWVMRYALVPKGSGLTLRAGSFAWLLRDNPPTAEQVLFELDDISPWLNAVAAPVKLSALKAFVEGFDFAPRWGALLKAGRTRALSKLAADGAPTVAGAGIPAQYMRELLEVAEKTYEDRSYYVVLKVAIPIGVVQASRKQLPQFLYAVAPAPSVVRQYGTPEQVQALRKVYHRSRDGQGSFNDSASWILLSASQPLRSLVFHGSAPNSTLDMAWAKAKDSHHRGGYKRKARMASSSTVAQRRSAGGDPRHRETVHRLSISRAFDVLMGHAARDKRVFERQRAQRVNRVSWMDVPYHERNLGADNTDAIKALRAKLRAAPFDAKYPLAAMLSPLVWNAQQRRGIGNAFFNVRESKRG